MKEHYCLQAALVCLGVLCHSQAMATERRSHLRPSFHGHHEKGKEGQVLQRSKRGWVWNQFFVIEEYTGPDPVLVGRVRLLPRRASVFLSAMPIGGYDPKRKFPGGGKPTKGASTRIIRSLLKHPFSLLFFFSIHRVDHVTNTSVFPLNSLPLNSIFNGCTIVY